MTTVQVLYWQDVPSVIKATGDDGREVKHQLPEWYQEEIDKRAMVQGLADSDSYLEQWHWSEPEERPGSPEDAVAAVERELDERT
jgi:hypothetical protein